MAQKGKSKDRCASMDEGLGSCKVESLISVDGRGQMVLPKEIREKANIRAGDKLTLISLEKDGRIRCLSLIKAEELTEMIKGILGPMVKEILG